MCSTQIYSATKQWKSASSFTKNFEIEKTNLTNKRDNFKKFVWEEISDLTGLKISFRPEKMKDGDHDSRVKNLATVHVGGWRLKSRYIITVG